MGERAGPGPPFRMGTQSMKTRQSLPVPSAARLTASDRVNFTPAILLPIPLPSPALCRLFPFFAFQMSNAILSPLIFPFLLCFSWLPISSALLFVQQNEIRSVDQLDGLWVFIREPPNSNGIGMCNGWAGQDLATFENSTVMPVPAAFNELGGAALRDHVGWVWYQRKYYVAAQILRQNGRRSFLRFGSVQYNAFVFLNGQFLGGHTGGHLPFQFELPKLGSVNSITVAVNNTLSDHTIPPGDLDIAELSDGKQIVRQTPNFDFFNYAGILRPVSVWHLPQAHISAIKIIAEATGHFSYRIDIDHGQTGMDRLEALVSIFFNNTLVTEMQGLENFTTIFDAQLWWPKDMGKANRYVAKVAIVSSEDGASLVDVYRETFGFRSVSIRNRQIHINGRPFYCHGFGMHEDFDVHGRGFDRSVMVKDLNMVEWLHGNCYRTSHYPYSEERAYEADRRGIAVITEVPAVGLMRFTRQMQELHGQMIKEMVMRDRNHPSVIIWSLANEPAVDNSTTGYEYFSELALSTKNMDGTRPVTAVFGHLTDRKIANALDVICLNRYYGWYSDLNMLAAIKDRLVAEFRSWRKEFGDKPLVLSEYGAEAIPGFHGQPAVAFTEEYQAKLIQLTGQALDVLRQTGDVSGEMIWNFADFMTSQSIDRIVGNHKGVLSRARQPKMGAFVIQRRYRQLSREGRRRAARKVEL